MRLPLNSGWLGKISDRGDSLQNAGGELPAVRTALLAHIRASSSVESDRDRARNAVRELCEVAHRRHLRAEQLLVAIKGVWRSMPEARVGGRPVATQRSLDRFISLCIAEYYARRD